MKKWSLLMIVTLILSFTSIGFMNIGVKAAENMTNQTKQTLTEQQKTELAAMHKEVLAKEKAIIAKYVEFGVMSKQAGDMLTSHMDKRFEKIQENGYIPPRHFEKIHPGKPPLENSPREERNE